MDYVHGETLAALLGSARLVASSLAPALASAVMVGALHGLHAAHEAVNEAGQPLGLVHGDVSPRNIIVDVDGGPRVLDFGVAKIGPGAARGLSRLGTPGYMSPEKLLGDHFDRRADVFSAGAVLWEMLCLRRLFPRADKGPQRGPLTVVPPSTFNPEVSPALDAVVLRALCADKGERFPSALAFAAELERACPPAPTREVSAWVLSTRGPALARRARELERIEAVSIADRLDAGFELGRPSERPPARLPEPPLTSRPVPPPPAPEPTIIELPRVELPRPAPDEEPPTVVQPTIICALARPEEPAAAPVARAVEEAPPPRPLRPLRRLPASARAALPALALLAAMYTAAAFDGQRVTATTAASAAPPLPEVLPPPAPPPSSCVAASVAPPVSLPEMLAPIPPETTAPTVPDDVAGAPTPPPVRAPAPVAITIAGLNRRAIAAYQQREAGRALRLLSEGLRLCQRGGLQHGELAALTHLNLGIVLAGGFGQRGLAIRHFRQARSIRPDIQPSGSVLSPEITAAFAEAR
jgi:serine/threonine-protein kinase